uniref:Uncharacterized protein n=1 Tax=Anopheles atroparvus TaxID=41427 RepID=A0AAG5DUR8_ANOAO
MAQPRNGAQHPAVATAGERPLSFYDNLASSAIAHGATGGGRVIQFPDIQFRFDESIPDRRSVHSSAKSDFFGLLNTTTTTSNSAVAGADDDRPDTAVRRSLPPAVDEPPPPPPTPSPPPPQPPTHDGGASVSASPTSTASTVPAQSSRDSYGAVGDPPGTTSTPRTSRPSSTIKTITIKLPDSGVGPSEAVYMTTTVPQNFTKNSNTLIGRHKPTRSSLRHSRMLVVNKTVPQRYPRGNSLNLRHVRLSKALMVLLILIGLALSLVGLAITIWSPSTQTKDNPYWSGIVLILCGSLFLLLFEFKRGRTLSAKGVAHLQPQQQQQQRQQQQRLAHHQVRHRWRESCFHFLHVNALVVLLLTIFFTMLAFIYALIHAANLSSAGLRCEPQFPFNVNSSTCVCTIETPAAAVAATAQQHDSHPTLANATGSSGSFGSTEGVMRLEYRDFSCGEVHGIWYYVTITSTLLNSAGCLLAATFLVIYAIECIRRPESDPQRTGAAAAATTTAVTNGRTATGSATGALEDQHRVTPVNASTVPLLQYAAAHQPSATTEANCSVASGTGSQTTAQQLAEENTTLTTTIASDELEDDLDASP